VKFEDIAIDDALNIGDTCYYNHTEYTYLGLNEEEKLILKVKGNDDKTIITSAKPVKPKLPLNIYVKTKRGSNFGEIVGYVHMLDNMYYRIAIYENVFKDSETETFEELQEKYELLEESPFYTIDDLGEKLVKLDEESNPIEREIRELQAKLEEIESRRSEVQKFCKHEWYKYDEVEVSKNNFEQECECKICGKVKYNRYSRLW